MTYIIDTREMKSLQLDRMMESKEQMRLQFSSEQMKQAWPDNLYSNDSANWKGYINRLCSVGFLSGLKELLEGTLHPELSVWPSEEDIPTISEVVNGTAIDFGETRLILIPSEIEELDEFSVPREWVDIPSWAGDYYLPIQMVVDEEADNAEMRVLGYATHWQLKENGKYDSVEETYCLEPEDLITDFVTFWLAQQLRPRRKAAVAELTAPKVDEASRLLRQLSEPSLCSPRHRVGIDVGFEPWAALLANPAYRQKLYQLRLKKESMEEIGIAGTARTTVKLREWFDSVYATGWQTIEEIWEQFGIPEANLAYGLRGHPGLQGLRFDNPDAVQPLISLLRSDLDKWTHLPAVELLGRIGRGNPEAIATLTYIMDTTLDKDLLRCAAVNLGKIDPGNPRAGARGAKVIDLGLQLEGRSLVLIVTLLPKGDRETSVSLKMEPGREKYLPSGLQLTVLDETGLEVMGAYSRSADSAIQLGFSGDRGDFFRVKVSLGETSIVEDFLL